MTRAIVQDPGILAGRWRLDHTTMSIATIREDGNRMGREDTIRLYEFMDLSEDEYSAIMVFDFPEVRGLTVDMMYSSVLVQCVCGEDTPSITKDSAANVFCICGRTWKVQVGVQGVEPQA